MKWKPWFGDLWTDVLAAVTLVAVVTAAWLLAGAGLFNPHGKYPKLDELNQIGGFLGGTFAPIVLAWAARTFFLQREQLILSMHAMATQAELQTAANAQQAAQLATLERHRDEDRQQEELRTAPQFSLRSITNDWSDERKKRRYVIEILNVGALAVGYRIRIYAANLVGKERILFYDEESALPFRPEEGRTFEVFLEDTSSAVIRAGFVTDIDMLRSDQRIAYESLTCDSDMAHFDLEVFEAVAKQRKFKLAAFGGRTHRGG